MVNRLAFKLILLPMLWALVSTAAASETLSVEPDRTRLYSGEVLSLTVKGTMTIDINLSNLFNFDASSLPQPDIEKVEDDFEILGQNQRYSIQTVNGEMIGEVTWTYQLAPKSPGTLTIPSLTFKGAESDPVTIEVVDGNPSQQDDSLRDSFIELSTTKDTVYVQEQLVLSVKLFFNGNMVRGELSEPTHPNAIIESLGKQNEYTRYRDGTRYRVVERRYAIFPQQPGELALPPIRFEGQTRDPSGRLKFLRDSQRLFTVPVKDVPDSFTGDTWLPVSELSLSESGLPNDPAINTGQNLSRTLSVFAEGVPAETLPPFSHDMPQGIRAYPESPERTTVPTETGLAGKLTQTTALVPTTGGKLTLPEIRVPWWDTTTDSQKVATIAARTFNVTPAPGQPQSDVSQIQTPEQSAQTATEPALNEPENGSESAPVSLWKWQVAALVLLAGWVITGICWWYSRRSRPRPEPADQNPGRSEKVLFTTLCESARAGAPETPDHLIRWVQHLHPQSSVVGLGDVKRIVNSDVVEQEIKRLQARAYGQQGGGAEDWQGERLVEALTACRQGMISTPNVSNPLPALYPDELNTGPAR